MQEEGRVRRGEGGSVPAVSGIDTSNEDKEEEDNDRHREHYVTDDDLQG